MDTIGLDLHKRESQLCALTEAGEIVKHRIVTSQERFAAVLGDRPRARWGVSLAARAKHLAGFSQESPVGIEPTNRGFAVDWEPQRLALFGSVPLHRACGLFGKTSSRRAR